MRDSVQVDNQDGPPVWPTAKEDRDWDRGVIVAGDQATLLLAHHQACAYRELAQRAVEGKDAIHRDPQLAAGGDLGSGVAPPATRR